MNSNSTRGTPPTSPRPVTALTDEQIQTQYPARETGNEKRYQLLAQGIERLLMNRGGTWEQLQELFAYNRDVLAGYQGLATPEQVGEDGAYRGKDKEETPFVVLKITNPGGSVYCESFAWIDPTRAATNVKSAEDKKKGCEIS